MGFQVNQEIARTADGPLRLAEMIIGEPVRCVRSCTVRRVRINGWVVGIPIGPHSAYLGLRHPAWFWIERLSDYRPPIVSVK